MASEPEFAGNPARDHERYLAGCCLHGADDAAEVQARIRVDDFADYPSRLVVQAAFDLLADGREPNLEGAYLLLGDRGKRDDLGPEPHVFLADLFERSATGANIGYAAGQVRDWSIRRRVAALGNLLAHDANHPSGSAEELVAAAERGLRELAESSVSRGPVHVGDAIRDALARYDERRPAAVTTTGLADLDDAMSGGFRAGELVLIGARPGVGKSALCLRLAEAAAESAGVLFFGLEMPTGESVDRLLAAGARVPLPKLRGKGRIDTAEAARLGDQLGRDRLGGLRLWFDDRADLTVGQIAAVVRRHVRRHGVRVVVVDYLQLVKADDRRAPRYEQVGAVSRGLKLLAKDAGITVVAAAQLNRDGDGNEPPRLSHLRESGSLEQDSDVVLLLHRPGSDSALSQTTGVELYLAKQRNGISGVKIDLEYHRQYTRFAPRVPL